MGSSLGSSDSVAGHLVTLKFYKNNYIYYYYTFDVSHIGFTVYEQGT